jgi:hypothetical protein
MAAPALLVDSHRMGRRQITNDLITAAYDLARHTIKRLDLLHRPRGVHDPRDARSFDLAVVLIDESTRIGKLLRCGINALQQLDSRRIALLRESCR